MAVLYGTPGALNHHQARAVAGLDGRLGNKFRGQIIIEITGFHIALKYNVSDENGQNSLILCRM
jgi:hypothetical protein